MGMPDLVFMLAAAALLVALFRAAAHAASGRWSVARRIVLRAGCLVIAYLGLVIAVSLASPRRWIPLGAEQRFDDWGLTVERAERTPTGFRIVVRVANHGRGRAQAARDAELVLVTASGQLLRAEPAPGARSLQSVVGAGESFETVREFEVPAGVQVVGLDVRHGAWPELFILGDRGSLFAKRPLVALPADSP